jgi:hypothetical protein
MRIQCKPVIEETNSAICMGHIYQSKATKNLFIGVAGSRLIYLDSGHEIPIDEPNNYIDVTDRFSLQEIKK